MPLLPASGYLTPAAPTVEPSPVPLTPYQEIRASPDAFGGATAQALSGLGTSLEKAAGHLESTQQFYDQVTVDEQRNSYEDKVNKTLYGDPSKPGDVGYMGLQGKNALEQRNGARQAVDAMLADHRSQLKNPRQVYLFDQEVSRYRNYALSSIGRHYDEQYNKHAAETAKDTLKLKLNEGAVASNNNDFPRLKSALESSLVAGEQYLRLNGASDATIALHRTQTVQAFTSTWANDAIVRNAPEGKQFVLDHKDELGDQYDNLLQKANAASLQYDVDRMKNGLPPVTSQPNLVRGGATQTRISQEASKAGLDPATILAFADIESSMGSNLGRRGNIFQLGQSEWAAAGGGPMGDTETDIKNGLSDIKKREADLTAALGRKPEGWELYLAHQQGVGGAISLLTNPNTTAGNLVRNPSYISGNGGDPNAPASQFVAKTRALFEERRARYSGGETPTQPPATTAGGDQPAADAPGPMDVEARYKAAIARGDTVRAEQILKGEPPTAPGAGATGGGPAMPPLPPNDPSDFPDSEIPGLTQKLQEGAKLLPPGAKPEVWNAYVRSVRQDANIAYNQKMHAEREKALAQQRTDEEVGGQYYERMVPGGTNRPSDAEIRTDKRLSLKMRENLIGALNAPNHPQPSAAQSEVNRIEAYQRLGAEVNGKPQLKKTSDIAALMSDPTPADQRITWHQFQDLNNVLLLQNNAKRQFIQPHITQLLRDAERVLFPLKHMKDGVGIRMDEDGPMRERRYQMFVENTVQDYITEGKDVRKLFEPGAPDKPNPEYLGNRAILDEYGKGAKPFGRGQATANAPAEGELKDNPAIMKAYKEGRFGTFGTQEAIEAAKQYSIRAGLSMRKQVVPETGVPMR